MSFRVRTIPQNLQIKDAFKKTVNFCVSTTHDTLVNNLIDQWVKNKCMFWFLVTWFIFNLHRRNIFLLYQIHTLYVTILKVCMNLLRKKRKKTHYLECRIFIHGSESPSLSFSCSKPTAPFETPPSLYCPPTRKHSIYLYTDSINMPESSSVGHNPR